MRKPSRNAWNLYSRVRALLLALAIASVCAQGVLAQSSPLAALLGQWTTLADQVPINPVHVALLHNGKVLIVSSSGNVATNTDYQTAVWDPQTQVVVTQPVAWDMFCNGMVVLPDGRPLINGGNLQYDFCEPSECRALSMVIYAAAFSISRRSSGVSSTATPAVSTNPVERRRAEDLDRW